MYFDWVVNVHGNGIGIVFIFSICAPFPIATQMRFPRTNNTVEHEVCITELKVALHMKIKDVEVYGDSILIISQST